MTTAAYLNTALVIGTRIAVGTASRVPVSTVLAYNALYLGASALTARCIPNYVDFAKQHPHLNSLIHLSYSLAIAYATTFMSKSMPVRVAFLSHTVACSVGIITRVIQHKCDITYTEAQQKRDLSFLYLSGGAYFSARLIESYLKSRG